MPFPAYQKFWMTGTGNKVLIRDMTSFHILSAARYLRRKAAQVLSMKNPASRKTEEIRLFSYNQFISSFKRELQKRGREGKDVLSKNPGLFQPIFVIETTVTWKLVKLS